MSASRENRMLRAGYASIEITPHADVPLANAPFRRARNLSTGNDGVHDPLCARVLVLRDPEAVTVLASVDVCRLETRLARHLRRVMAELVRTDIEHVILAGTRSAHAPIPRYRGNGRNDEANDASVEIAYADFLEERLREAVILAAAQKTPVRVGVREAPLGLGYIRRVPSEDGLRYGWNLDETPELRPRGVADPVCTVILFEQDGGPRRWVLWSLGAQPGTLGEACNLVSADFPGATARLLEQFEPESRALFFLGAAGDAQPWVSGQTDPAQLEPVAFAAAGMVNLLARSIRPQAVDGPVLTAGKTVTLGELEYDLTAWRIGDAYLCALPGEPFGELATDLRQRLDGPLLLAACANGYTGYWPTASTFEEGGHEVEEALRFGVEAGSGERLMAMTAALTGSLVPQNA